MINVSAVYFCLVVVHLEALRIFLNCKVHLLGVGTRGQRPFVDSLSVHVCSLVKFFAEVVKSLLQYVMVYSVYPQNVCSVNLI